MMKNKGFTLIEVIIGAGILAGLFVGLMSIYFYCFDLQETARNTSLALNEVRARLEEIKNSDFANVRTTYVGEVLDGVTTVTTSNLTSIPTGGIMRIEANTVIAVIGISNRNLIDLRIVACWRQKGGRIVGTATLDGNGNFTDCTNSPVELATSISNRE